MSCVNFDLFLACNHCSVHETTQEMVGQFVLYISYGMWDILTDKHHFCHTYQVFDRLMSFPRLLVVNAILTLVFLNSFVF